MARRATTVIALTAAVILTVVFVSNFQRQGNQQTPSAVKAKETACLTASVSSEGCDFDLGIADTGSERTKGLSGRESLAQKSGMLFIFDAAGEQCMWMKNMRFSIDMLWLNEKKDIVKIQNSVAPETYPESFCAPGVKYVIELNSGDVKTANFVVGQQVKF